LDYAKKVLLSRRSQQQELINASELSSVCLSLCLSVSLSIAKMQKRDFLEN